VRHVAATTGLPPGQAARVVEDVLAFHAETVEDYVRRRHRELHRRGLTNAAIFRVVAGEVPHRVFAAPPLSERQVRRIVHG